jgi:flagellar hook-length control protein FliK
MVPLSIDRPTRSALPEPVNASSFQGHEPRDDESSFAAHLREAEPAPRSSAAEAEGEREAADDREKDAEQQGSANAGDGPPSDAQNTPHATEAAPEEALAPAASEAAPADIAVDVELSGEETLIEAVAAANAASKTKAAPKPAKATGANVGKPEAVTDVVESRETPTASGEQEVAMPVARTGAKSNKPQADVVSQPAADQRQAAPVQSRVTEQQAVSETQQSAQPAEMLTAREDAEGRAERQAPADKTVQSGPAVIDPLSNAAVLAASEGTSKEGREDKAAARDTAEDAVTESDQVTPSPHSRFSQQLLPRGTETTAPTVHLTDVDQSRLLDRVARAVRLAEGHDGLMRIRLHPPELGSLRLEVRVQSGVLTARLEADTPQARAVLVDNLPVLRERLAEQGVRIEQFDVDLRDRHGGEGASAREQQSQREPSERPTPARESQRNEELPTAVPEVPSAASHAARRLDVMV